MAPPAPKKADATRARTTDEASAARRNLLSAFDACVAADACAPKAPVCPDAPIKGAYQMSSCKDGYGCMFGCVYCNLDGVRRRLEL